MTHSTTGMMTFTDKSVKSGKLDGLMTSGLQIHHEHCI